MPALKEGHPNKKPKQKPFTPNQFHFQGRLVKHERDRVSRAPLFQGRWMMDRREGVREAPIKEKLDGG